MKPDSPSELLNTILRDFGFSKKNTRLWLRKNECSWNLVGLQKSRFGPQYFINLGVWFPLLDYNPQPRPQDCHIQIRIGEVTDNSNEVERALDFEDPWKMDLDSRKFEIYCAIKDVEKNLFGLFSSVEAVSSFFTDQPFGHFAIQSDLVRALQKHKT